MDKFSAQLTDEAIDALTAKMKGLIAYVETGDESGYALFQEDALDDADPYQ